MPDFGPNLDVLFAFSGFFKNQRKPDLNDRITLQIES